MAFPSFTTRPVSLKQGRVRDRVLQAGGRPGNSTNRRLKRGLDSIDG